MLKRVAVVLVGIVLALGGLVFVVAAAQVADTPTCRDVNRGVAEPRDNECYDGSTKRRALQVGLSGLAGLIAMAALVPAIAYGSREIWLTVFLAMLGSSLLLVALYALVGRI